MTELCWQTVRLISGAGTWLPGMSPWWLCHTPWNCFWLCRGYSRSELPSLPAWEHHYLFPSFHVHVPLPPEPARRRPSTHTYGAQGGGSSPISRRAGRRFCHTAAVLSSLSSSLSSLIPLPFFPWAVRSHPCLVLCPCSVLRSAAQTTVCLPGVWFCSIPSHERSWHLIWSFPAPAARKYLAF